jgi:hypothetical protein
MPEWAFPWCTSDAQTSFSLRGPNELPGHLSYELTRLTRFNFCKVVARGGSAPPISGCRPDVMLFHYRALRIWTADLPGQGTRGMRNWEIAAKEHKEHKGARDQELREWEIAGSLKWLPHLDSHQDRRGQNPVCCCYTTRQLNDNVEGGTQNSKWLPGMDSHHHSRLQRAMSC